MSLTSRQFLSIYTLKVRKRHSHLMTFDYLSESDEFDDFFDVLSEFLKDLKKNPFHDEEEDTVLGIQNLNIEPRKRRISGFIVAGNAGVEGFLHNTIQKKNTKFNREDAPLYNYYFCFFVPKVGERGVLALHSRGNHGCKLSLETALRNYLSNIESGITAIIEATALDFKRDYKKFHRHFSVKRLQVVDYIPKRNEDRLMTGGRNEEVVKIRHSVSVGRNVSSLFNFDDFAKAKNFAGVIKRKFRNYTAIRGLSSKADYSITVDMDGQEKTMSVRSNMSFHMSFDLTEDFDTYNRKDPSFKKLQEVSEIYINHAIEHLT